MWNQDFLDILRGIQSKLISITFVLVLLSLSYGNKRCMSSRWDSSKELYCFEVLFKGWCKIAMFQSCTRISSYSCSLWHGSNPVVNFIWVYLVLPQLDWHWRILPSPPLPFQLIGWCKQGFMPTYTDSPLLRSKCITNQSNAAIQTGIRRAFLQRRMWVALC